MKVKISTSPTHSELEEIDLSLTTRRGAECMIGRSPDSDLVLDSEDVSRQHGKFFYRSGNYYFCDLGSRNGTVINGKLAEENHPYILKNGDIIRIGDFALSLEEDISLSEQAETVVRIINPSTFSNWKNDENVSSYEANTPSSELVNQTEEVLEPAIDEPIVNETPVAEEKYETEELLKIPEPSTFVQSDVINNQAVDSGKPVEEEAIANISDVESEFTDTQTDDVSQDDEDRIDSDAEEIAVQNQEENLQEVISQEDDLDSEPEEIALQTEEENLQEVISQEDDLNLDAEEIAVQNQEENPQEVISQEDNLDSDAEEIALQTEEENLQEAVSEVKEVQSIENNNILDVILDTGDMEEVGDELVSEAASISTSELVDEESQAANQEIEKDAVEDITEEESVIKVAKILEEKQIILVAHETRKHELKELAAEHEEFLSYCLTVTWQNFSSYLYNEAGLKITQDIPPARSGGYQAINSLINSKEVIAVIFLRDLIVRQQGQASEEALLRTCNMNEVLLATNLPTAQAIVHYLKNMKDS